MQVIENIKDTQGAIENLFLTKLLINSLKSHKECSVLTERGKKKQRELALAAFAFETETLKILPKPVELTPTKTSDLGIMVNLLSEATPTTAYIIQYALEMLRMLNLYSKLGKKVNPEKYKALFQYITKEMEADAYNGQSALHYGEEGILTFNLMNPFTDENLKEKIHGT